MCNSHVSAELLQLLNYFRKYDHYEQTTDIDCRDGIDAGLELLGTSEDQTPQGGFQARQGGD